MAELVREARAQLVAARGGRARLAELDDLGDAPSDETILVGTYAGVAVGVCSVRSTRRDGSHVMVIDLLYVEPQARGVGVGARLLEECLHLAEASGAESIDVAALPGDRETKSLLEGAGFKARLVVMARAPGSGFRR